VNIHVEFLQASEHHQKVDAVAAEAADRFGVDEIDLASFAISHEVLEAGTGLYAPSRADVRIGVYVLPKGIVQDILLLEVHLGREAVQLTFHLRAHSAVQRNSLESARRLHGSRDGSYRGLGLFISGHDWSCIARRVRGWIVLSMVLTVLVGAVVAIIFFEISWTCYIIVLRSIKMAIGDMYETGRKSEYYAEYRWVSNSDGSLLPMPQPHEMKITMRIGELLPRVESTGEHAWWKMTAYIT
jgi:hypothetical protein